MLSIGLDGHQRLYVLCIGDGSGRILERRTIRGDWRQLIGFLRSLATPFQIVYEASSGSGFLYDRLKTIARRIVVAHPGHLRLIFKAKRKNDRVDAEKLYKLLLLDAVPAVYVPTPAVRDWRKLIEFRSRLVAKRTRVKNAIRALLKDHGLEAPKRGTLWTTKGIAWLRELTLETHLASLQRDMLLDEHDAHDEKIKRLERELDAVAADHAGAQLLRTIPGVGPRTSEAVMAAIDDPRRFRRNKAIGAYFGLVPCQDESAGKARFGHVTREGPATVRRLLTEAAWQGIRRSDRIRAFYEQVKHDDPQRNKIALVATAHHLAKIMLSMLKSGEVWHEEPRSTTRGRSVPNPARGRGGRNHDVT